MTAGSPGRSFDETAPAYAARRPGYPEQALEWLLPPGVPRVLDLGAGTGKLTRQLAARGLDVVAVEPSPQMGAELVAALPAVTLLPGTAEDIPLPAADVDAVLVGSAFHWFDQDRALAEIRRVLRPGGRLGMVANLSDGRRAWVADLDALTGARERRAGRRLVPVPDRAAGFTAVAGAEFDHEFCVTGSSLRELLTTYSWYLLLGEPDRAALLAAVDRLVTGHPELRGHDEFTLPFVAHCWRAVRV